MYCIRNLENLMLVLSQFFSGIIASEKDDNRNNFALFFFPLQEYVVDLFMATAAPSPLASSVEKTNGAKLSRLLIDGGTTVLRNMFDGYHHPANLISVLNANYSLLNNLLRRRVLNGHQWDKLFPPVGVAPDSKTFDITLLFLLLTKICGLTPPPSGWHTKPPSSDTSHEANLARVKFYRNILYGHVTTTGVDTATFSALWTKISGVFVSLGLDQAEVNRLKAEKGGEQDYIDVLIKWAVSEEDIKSQLKALKNIEQSQTQSQQAIEEIAVGLQEVRQAVEELRHQRDEEKDAVLQKLARSEFRGDIDYYVQRFQADTREWVFDRVQNWLDDTSSQNRVMVISGNAGMGKSVIAAVICKRMQEAGRLSGSHFCQYNNVRYCKPQLMIQSLACHLSHALPEYKQALVEQLSRNLGTDLNNMGVEELFALLFKEPLSVVGDPGRNMLVVIDGLDESEYQGRNELLDVIASQFCKLPVWTRFFVTTRPALNILEKLKHLNPFELKCNDEKNLQDVRVFFQKKLEHVLKGENVGKFLERLVLKSEGLLLFAHFLILSITQNTSICHEGDLVDSLPLGISSVYHSYFKRLERELVKELDVKVEHFLNLLSAITASREPLPVGFISKVLVPSSNSPLARRKVLSALNCVSALLPVRDDCLHVIHKSVKDWLTDISCYGEHEFTMDENDGQRILASLCTEELDGLKRKGVDNVQFNATQSYALYHGAHHMLHGVSTEPHKLNEMTKAYFIDLEIVYAKTRLSSTMSAEDLLWLKKHWVFPLLSKDNQSILDALLFLLRKFVRRFTDTPRMFLETILNQGGKELTVEAWNHLRNKYPEIPYMEVVHKEVQQGGVVARFECSSDVVCLDVSPQLDYLVCECNNGMLQLWSLHSGKLMWTRSVKVEKSFENGFARDSPPGDVSLYRSVVFHPTKECVLPGILRQAYTINGDLIHLFPGSDCRFSVCSISRDKTRIVTNCLENSKCLFLWNLENGTEVDRICVGEDILSFALSGDGRLIAISRSSGLVSLFDIHGLRDLVHTANGYVCGVVKFSPDNRFLFCCHGKDVIYPRVFCLRVVKDSYDEFSLEKSYGVSYDVRSFEPFNDCGFLFGDLISLDRFLDHLTFVLDEQRLLRCKLNAIEMVNIKDFDENDQGQSTGATGIALSLHGQTVYVASNTSVTAWDAFRGKSKSEICFGVTVVRRLCPVGGGLLIATRKNTVEMWNYDLSKCVKRWTNLPGVKQLIPLSEKQVAVVRDSEVKVVDTSSGQFVSTIPVLNENVLTFNSKRQLLTISTFDSMLFDLLDIPQSLQLLDGTTVVWKKEDVKMGFSNQSVAFSPTSQFLIVRTAEGMLVLNGGTGDTLHALRSFYSFSDCTFISDDACVISGSNNLTVQLLNVKSGELLSEIDVESDVTCLAACPLNRVLAIGLLNSDPNFKVIRVHLPQEEDSEKRKR